MFYWEDAWMGNLNMNVRINPLGWETKTLAYQNTSHLDGDLLSQVRPFSFLVHGGAYDNV